MTASLRTSRVTRRVIHRSCFMDTSDTPSHSGKSLSRERK